MINSWTGRMAFYLLLNYSEARRLALTAVGDGDGGLGLARAGTLGLDTLDNVHTLDDLAEDDVLAVQPGGDNGGDEEL